MADKTKRKAENTNTPYDDAFRTILIECRKLVIPVVNEIFGTHFTREESITVLSNERFLMQEGVLAAMGGEILDYEARSIKQEGRKEERKKLAELAQKMLADGRAEEFSEATASDGEEKLEALFREYQIPV